MSGHIYKHICRYTSTNTYRQSLDFIPLSSEEALRERERGDKDRENRACGGSWEEVPLASFYLPRDLRALTILFPSPPIYLLLSLALQPAPLEKPQGTSAEERHLIPRQVKATLMKYWPCKHHNLKLTLIHLM